jgi:hypothetical protein
MRPVELESRLEKGSGPPRSACVFGGPGRGTFTLRAFVSRRDPDWSANRHRLPAGRPNLDQPPLRPEDLPPRRGRTSAGIVVAGARAVRTPSASYPRGRTFKSSPRLLQRSLSDPLSMLRREGVDHSWQQFGSKHPSTSEPETGARDPALARYAHASHWLVGFLARADQASGL